MDERKIRELSTKTDISANDFIVIEDDDGTKTIPTICLKQFMINNLIFDTIEDLKSASLKEGETCITLGYHTINDGGAGTYKVEYDPAAVEDNGLVHCLNTSDVLRAKLIVSDYVVPEQFGAYGTGNKDDINAITKAINSGFAVKFISGHKYSISSPIKPVSDLFIDFNGCTIIPNNCDLIAKLNVPSEDPIQNIVIKNFIANMKNGFNGINISHPIDGLIIDNFKIINNSRDSIRLGSVDRGIIKNGIISGDTSTNSQTGIGVINPSRTGFGDSTVVIDCIKFSNVYPAITVNNTESEDPVLNHVTVRNCSYINDIEANSDYANFILLYGKKNTTIIENLYVKNVNIVAKINSTETSVSMKDIYAYDCTNLLDIINTDAEISLDGNIIMGGNYQIPLSAVVNRLYGTLNINCNWKIENLRHIFRDTDSLKYSGMVLDNIDPKSYSAEVVTSKGSTLFITSLGNCFIDVQTTEDIISIDGIDGQRIYLISSIGRSIIPSANIILKDNTNQKLSKYSGIELKKIGSKWVQI